MLDARIAQVAAAAKQEPEDWIRQAGKGTLGEEELVGTYLRCLFGVGRKFEHGTLAHVSSKFFYYNRVRSSVSESQN